MSRHLLTSDPNTTAYHVAPMKYLNTRKLREYGRRWKRYRHIVGVRPTGWTFRGKRDNKKGHATPKSNGPKKGGTGICSVRKARGTHVTPAVSVYGVAYSEHSSFNELVDCLRVLSPRRVIPTVNCGTMEKVRSQVRLLQSFKKMS